MSGDPSTQTVSTADVREPSSAEADCRGGSRCFFTTAVAVGLPVLVFVVLRLPALVHQPGAQDEQYFSVAGLTAATEGIPRIPYYPTRNPATFFDRADQCLMALPPGLFYAQAPFFRVFPAGYPTSRIPVFLGGVILLVLTFVLCRRLGCGQRASCGAAVLLAMSRPLMFTAIIARPDILCILCGVTGVLVMLSIAGSVSGESASADHPRWKIFVLLGGLCGLAALFHPFALVFCLQAAAFALFLPGTISQRIGRVIVLGTTAVLVAGLWLPLILAYPDEFQSQFFANVLNRAGPGLPQRLLWPIPSFRNHAKLLWEFAGPFQCLLLIVSAVVGTPAVLAVGRRFPTIAARTYIALLWSAGYLTATVAGLHPTKGYWLYPFVLALPAFAMICDTVAGGGHCKRFGRVRGIAVWIAAFALMLPGGGLKSSWLYLRHWGDPQYHAGMFIRGVLSELPREGLFLADLSYVFDVYLSGRDTLLCQDRTVHWGDRQILYSHLLLSWEGRNAGWAEQFHAKLDRSFGDRSQPQMCEVDVFVPAGEP